MHIYVSKMYHKLYECTPRHMHSPFWGRAWCWTHTCIITVYRHFVKDKASCKGKGQLLIDCGYQKWWCQAQHSLWPSFSTGISGIVEFCDPRKVVIACRCTVNAKARWLKFCSLATSFYMALSTSSFFSYFEDFFSVSPSLVACISHIYILQVQLHLATNWPSEKTNSYSERESDWSSGNRPSSKQVPMLFWWFVVKENQCSIITVGLSAPVHFGFSL